MLLVGEENNALLGLRNITIIAAAPFLVVMVLLRASLMRDLRHDPLILRGRRSVELVAQAVSHGEESFSGEEYRLEVISRTTSRPERTLRDAAVLRRKV